MKKFAEKIWSIYDANDLLDACKQRSTRKDYDAAVVNDDDFGIQRRLVEEQSLLAIGIREMDESFYMERLDGRGGEWQSLRSIKYSKSDKHLFRMDCVYVLYTDERDTPNVMIIGGANCRDLKKVNLYFDEIVLYSDDQSFFFNL